METDRLKHFCVLVETGSMRKAAELLRMSHGGLSKSIKVLETELNAELTVPAGRGLVITDVGRGIYRQACGLLRDVETMMDAKSRAAPHPPHLRIGSFEVFTTYALGEIARRTSVSARLTVVELIPGRIEAALLNDEIDIGITYIPIPNPGIDFVKVTDFDMGVFARHDVFQNIDYKELPFAAPITPIAVAPAGVRGLDGWPDHLFPRRIAFSVQLLESGLELCRQGLAVMHLPRFIIAAHNEIVNSSYRLTERDLPRNLSRFRADVFLAKRANQPESKAMKAVAAALRTVCKRRV